MTTRITKNGLGTNSGSAAPGQFATENKAASSVELSPTYEEQLLALHPELDVAYEEVIGAQDPHQEAQARLADLALQEVGLGLREAFPDTAAFTIAEVDEGRGFMEVVSRVDAAGVTHLRDAGPGWGASGEGDPLFNVSPAAVRKLGEQLEGTDRALEIVYPYSGYWSGTEHFEVPLDKEPAEKSVIESERLVAQEAAIAPEMAWLEATDKNTRLQLKAAALGVLQLAPDTSHLTLEDNPEYYGLNLVGRTDTEGSFQRANGSQDWSSGADEVLNDMDRRAMERLSDPGNEGSVEGLAILREPDWERMVFPEYRLDVQEILRS